jgi:hypothetical protein
MKYGQNHKSIFMVVVVVVGLPQAGRYLRAPACLTTIRALARITWPGPGQVASRKQDLPTLDVQFHELHLHNHIPARLA